MGHWTKEARHAYYEKNKSKIKQYTSDYYQRHLKEYQKWNKDYNLRRRYSLTAEQYENLLQTAGFRCQICEGTKFLCVDHDHITGKIRGMICSGCNVGLGHFKDSEIVLQAALDYLRRYK